MAIIIAEVQAEIRFLLGGLPVNVLSDEILTDLIQRELDKTGDADELLCLVTYNSVLATLQYLDRRDMQGSAATGASGDLKKRSEKIGNREVKVEYETGSDGGTAASWASLYNDFLKHPEYVCASLLVTDPSISAASLVKIGGTSQTQYDKVNSNTDSRSGYALNVRDSYGLSAADRLRRGGGW